MQMYIVLGLLVFMIAMFFTHKVPYGVTTMTCCVMLALTGVFDISTAFSGLANKTTILIACMFTVAYAFGKTSLINKVRNSMERIKGKSGLAFIIFLFLVTIWEGRPLSPLSPCSWYPWMIRMKSVLRV